MSDTTLQSILCEASVDWIEAAGAPTAKPKRFSIVAYTGGSMRVAAYYRPVVIDLAGLKNNAGEIPVLLGHDPAQIVGHGAPEITAQRIKLSGVISGAGNAAREVAESAKNGFPWKASVGITPESVEFVEPGSKATANGKTWTGPVNIVRSGVLGEVSFVPIAADAKTSATVSAHQRPDFQRGPTMNENETIETIRATQARETERIGAIRQVCGRDHGAIEAKAISEGWSPERTEIEVLRAERDARELHTLRSSRSTPPASGSDRLGRHGHAALEAAFARAVGVDVEEHFKPEVLEAADRVGQGYGLQELLLAAARENGYSGTRGRITQGSLKEILGYALPPVTASLPSTIHVSGILSNVAGKLILDGFNSVENTWRTIAKISSVSDFKTATRYRLTSSLEYEEVGSAGEIKHGTLGEESYTMEAKTYAKMLTLTRKDIINDDLGAFDQLRKRLGMGSALRINRLFWQTFLDDAAFFTTGRGNLIDDVLSTDPACLDNAIARFMALADSDGHPLGITPSILLVQPAQLATARRLFVSSEIRGTADDAFVVANPYQGMYTPEVSAYLSSTAIPRSSSTAWWLLADPAVLPVAEIAFLHGQQSPTVESADVDFNMLGISLRGYHDFGCTLAEYRAGVKSTGDAAE